MPSIFPPKVDIFHSSNQQLVGQHAGPGEEEGEAGGARGGGRGQDRHSQALPARLLPGRAHEPWSQALVVFRENKKSRVMLVAFQY